MNRKCINVSPSPSKIPYGGFSPVRLQTGSPRRSSRGTSKPHLYAAQAWPSDPMAISGMRAGRLSPRGPVQRPLAHQPVMLSGWVNAYYGLIRANAYYGLIRATRHSRTPYFLRPSGIHRYERVPNLICVSVRACHPQHPGGPIGSKRLLLPRPHWSSPPLYRLDTHIPRTLVLTRVA
jgi:hypothetical protein